MCKDLYLDDDFCNDRTHTDRFMSAYLESLNSDYSPEMRSYYLTFTIFKLWDKIERRKGWANAIPDIDFGTLPWEFNVPENDVWDKNEISSSSYKMLKYYDLTQAQGISVRILKSAVNHFLHLNPELTRVYLIIKRLHQAAVLNGLDLTQMLYSRTGAEGNRFVGCPADTGIREMSLKHLWLALQSRGSTEMISIY